ncbi:hypothetical protein GCM10022224_017270 [Nonomuraea antimicrobica]|uniref:Uncharacterized protein n=1 Tax=Nonomuraea antimicrobica TaxID=561173 RepID=A0ABP7BAN4_9ACTN
MVKDLRVARAPANADDLEGLEGLETDMPARLSDGTVASDVVYLEQMRPGSASCCGRGNRRTRVRCGGSREIVNRPCQDVAGLALPLTMP